MTTVLAFLVTLGVLIVVHEYGHYKVARLCGVKVLKFSIGFGRSLWRRQAHPDATEFVVAALPLGGYVKMLDEREGEVPPALQSQAFNRQSLPKRVAIVAAGPIANLLLAVLLYAAAHWIGMTEPKAVLSMPAPQSLAAEADMRSGDWVRAVSDDGLHWREVASLTDLHWAITQAAVERKPLRLQVSDREGQGRRELRLALDRLPSGDVDPTTLKRIGLGAPFSLPVMGRVVAGGAADEAGLREGDRVVAVDGRPVEDAASLRQWIRSSADQVMRWQIERGDRVQTLTVKPRGVDEGQTKVGRIEAAIGATPAWVTVRHGFWGGLQQGAVRTWDVSVMTVRMLGRMLIGQASLKNLSGPLTIADVAGQSAQLGITAFLAFLALVSVSLGVLNLLPLPMLDGGHLMYYLFEAVTGRPVSDLWLQRLQRGGVVVLLLLMSVALTNDLSRFFFR